MNTADLITQIRDTLVTDTALSAWCTGTFGKVPTVYVDIDERRPPDPQTDYPLVAITALRQTRGDSRRELTWELELGVGVVQDSVVESGNIKTYAGFLQVETLRELAEDALYRARIADLGSQGESGSLSLYPLFISGTVIPIKTLRSNRRGLPG